MQIYSFTELSLDNTNIKNKIYIHKKIQWLYEDNSANNNFSTI